MTAIKNMAPADVPAWDLTDLYVSIDDPAISGDIEQLDARAEAFRQRYAGKLAAIDGDALAQAIKEFEAIDEALSRILTFAGLVHAANLADPMVGRFYQSMQERVSGVSVRLVFFTLELNQLPDDALNAKEAASSGLRHYGPWLRDVRVFRPHQLSDELERYIHEKHVVGRAAWNRLFDETMAALQFTIGGAVMGVSEALNCLSSTDGARRKQAGIEIGRVMSENIRVFTLITNTLAKDKEIEDQWRRYPTPQASRHLSNFVEPEVVAALVDTVKSAYPALSHRYYALKAKWFGGDRLDYWDRNAPLPDDDDRQFSWSDARHTVLEAYGAFSTHLAEIGQSFFERRWIDAELRDGKAPGAFSHPSVPSAHPYILMNFHGKARDVMTLAHELGHGVHQVLAGRAQGHLMADTPLTLAETASVFGEMLTFRSLLEAENDPRRRRALIAAKVEDMLNTVVRQIAFYEFESRVHVERRSGELTAERLGDLWLAVQTESLGPALRFDDGYRAYWSYIPHFIHSPFYVYAYAFGDCLVNSLFAVYQDAERGFADRYVQMLSAGGTLRHREILAPFGLDASDPSFWAKGLSVLRGFIDDLEAADNAVAEG